MPTSGEIERDIIRKKLEIVIDDLSKCYYCHSTGLTENDKYCPHCGFPQRGTQQEMRLFLIKIKHKKELLEEKKKTIRRARNILFLLGAINLVGGIAYGYALPAYRAAIISLSAVVAAIYFGLGFWCRTNPFPAILSGFFVYVVLITVNAIVDPMSLFKGIIVKIVIVVLFIYGYKAVKESEQMKKELEALNTPIDLNTSHEVSELPV